MTYLHFRASVSWHLISTSKTWQENPSIFLVKAIHENASLHANELEQKSDVAMFLCSAVHCQVFLLPQLCLLDKQDTPKTVWTKKENRSCSYRLSAESVKLLTMAYSCWDHLGACCSSWRYSMLCYCSLTLILAIKAWTKHQGRCALMQCPGVCVFKPTFF